MKKLTQLLKELESPRQPEVLATIKGKSHSPLSSPDADDIRDRIESTGLELTYTSRHGSFTHRGTQVFTVPAKDITAGTPAKGGTGAVSDIEGEQPIIDALIEVAEDLADEYGSDLKQITVVFNMFKEYALKVELSDSWIASKYNR